MIEQIPIKVDRAVLYLHSARANGDELGPFMGEMRMALPTAYLWAGDGPVGGAQWDPLVGEGVGYADGDRRFWFVFPMHGNDAAAFTAAIEAMGAVQLTAGAYVNALADQVSARFGLPPRRIVLCGSQHGACVALAAAMMRRSNPFALTVLFDPWPLEPLYLAREPRLPHTQVICIDNERIRAREADKGFSAPVHAQLRQYGINAEGMTLPDGSDRLDAAMVREAVRHIRALP